MPKQIKEASPDRMDDLRMKYADFFHHEEPEPEKERCKYCAEPLDDDANIQKHGICTCQIWMAWDNALTAGSTETLEQFTVNNYKPL